MFLNGSAFPEMQQWVETLSRSWATVQGHPLFTLSKMSIKWIRFFQKAVKQKARQRKERIVNAILTARDVFKLGDAAGVYPDVDNVIYLKDKQYLSSEESSFLDEVSKCEPDKGHIEYILPLAQRDARAGTRLCVDFPRDGRRERIVLKVPEGTRDGVRIRVPAKGDASSPAGDSGDLYLYVSIR